MFDDFNNMSSTQITFLREPENEQTAQEYFKELVQSISMCKNIDSLDTMDITRNFRYSKYEAGLSINSLIVLKQFLIKNGHVIILHIFQSWFSIDITDADEETKDNSIMKTTNGTRVTNVASPTHEFDKPENLYAHLKAELGIDSKVQPETNNSNKNDGQSRTNVNQESSGAHRKLINHKLRYIRETVVQTKSYEQPVRTFKIANSDNRYLHYY